MSTIYFHTEQETASVRGSERAYASILCGDLMLAAIGNLSFAKDWLIPLLPPGNYVTNSRGDIEAGLALFLKGGTNEEIIVKGNAIDIFTLSLNTALVLGSDPVRLLARLHGQCEIHCWAEGKNKLWLADIIRAGRKHNLYRENQGWQSVLKLLERHNTDPVVCSYSVCDSFPNYSCLPKDHPLKQSHDERRFDQFHEIPDDEKWKSCMEGLRKMKGLELTPDNWDEFYFDSGDTIFSIKQICCIKGA